MARPIRTKEALLEDIKDIQRALAVPGYYQGAFDGNFGPASKQALTDALALAAVGAGRSVYPQRTLTTMDIRLAADKHTLPYSAVKAVIEVESGGGWYTDVRREILDLDGPGGFIDGNLLKILFEAKWFHKLTNGAYDAKYPDISSPIWNKSLYLGGQNEYRRYWKAATLDEEAAMKSTSWGMFQIMGFNHALCGYPDVASFVLALKSGEQKQLDTFLVFINNVRHKGKTLAQWLREKNWAMFAEGYNGPGYRSNAYDTKLAKEDKRYA